MQNHIIKFFLSAMFLSFPCAYFTAEGESVPTESPVAAVKAADEVVSLYHSMQLEGVVNWRAFKQAVTGYNRIKNRKRDVLTLIDFSKPSTEKRLYVFDMKHRRMLYSSVVSHGKNSGGIRLLQELTGLLPDRFHLSGTKRLFAHSRRAGERD